MLTERWVGGVKIVPLGSDAVLVISDDHGPDSYLGSEKPDQKLTAAVTLSPRCRIGSAPHFHEEIK